ncbi:tetratricopeptide repeat protein [Nesterenkonia lacusekhoensis]|uniref:Tetratricopeptide (TPR) repeat protein n=1 Tax=Nesterenkonia lacusekhoensis TaxID=150832 RepID=A0ABS4T063_9MICC|nr:tetratricopeptide repeat protein [Nesterenkonia lacusekhoensis]MBP2317540.1 tetratricopeptide (TPR) repeat protein [Nesterenkonia lacusekhoensis]
MSAGPHVTQDWIVGLTVTSESAAEDSAQAPSIQHLEEASAADPADLEALKALAEAYRISGDFDAALDTWEKVLTVNPTYQRGLSRLVAVGARGSMDWPRIWRSVRELEPPEEGQLALPEPHTAPTAGCPLRR